jgi:hypothetical protein
MSYFESSNEFMVSSQQTLLGLRALSLRLPISLSNMMSPHGPNWPTSWSGEVGPGEWEHR